MLRFRLPPRSTHTTCLCIIIAYRSMHSLDRKCENLPIIIMHSYPISLRNFLDFLLRKCIMLELAFSTRPVRSERAVVRCTSPSNYSRSPNNNYITIRCIFIVIEKNLKDCTRFATMERLLTVNLKKLIFGIL